MGDDLARVFREQQVNDKIGLVVTWPLQQDEVKGKSATLKRRMTRIECYASKMRLLEKRATFRK